MSKLGIKILKLGLISLGLITVILISVNFIVFQKIEDNIKSDVNKCIYQLKNSINGDKLEAIINSQSKSCSEYQEVSSSMGSAKSKSIARNYYTLYKVKGTEAKFLVDLSVESSEFLEDYTINKDMEKAFNGQIIVSSKPYTDKYGTFISAFAPIKNSEGKIVGITGVDVDTSLFVTIKSILFKTIIITISITFLLVIIIIYIYSKQLGKNVMRIQHVLGKMCSGDFTENINIKMNDEIGDIALSIDKVQLCLKDLINNTREISNDMGNSIDKVKDKIKNLNDDIEEVSAITEELSANMEETAASAEEMESSSNEIGSVINSMAERSKEGADKSVEISEKAKNIMQRSVNSKNETEGMIKQTETALKQSIEKAKNVQ